MIVGKIISAVTGIAGKTLPGIIKNQGKKAELDHEEQIVRSKERRDGWLDEYYGLIFSAPLVFSVVAAVMYGIADRDFASAADWLIAKFDEIFDSDSYYGLILSGIVSAIFGLRGIRSAGRRKVQAEKVKAEANGNESKTKRPKMPPAWDK